MNAERLHRILADVSNELTSMGLVGRVELLRASLQNMVNQPQQPQFQQEVSQQRQELNDILSDAGSDSFAPSWRQVLDELGISPMLGLELQEAIEEAFTQNEITPSKALESINELASQLKAMQDGLAKTLAGFEYLEVGQEELEAGQCEVGYLIPRAVILESLHGLQRSLLSGTSS
ncbi:MAG: hypothetical protein IPO17_11245 [Flavobacteriales bacterium]|nr:hypothetical protein [Flavobacteriales bacterium]